MGPGFGASGSPSSGGPAAVTTREDAAAAAGGTTSYTTTEVSPYTVPAGARLVYVQFKGDAGGGWLKFNGGDAIDLDEGELYEEAFPYTGPAVYPATSTVTWSGVAKFEIRVWAPTV